LRPGTARKVWLTKQDWEPSPFGLYGAPTARILDLSFGPLVTEQNGDAGHSIRRVVFTDGSLAAVLAIVTTMAFGINPDSAFDFAANLQSRRAWPSPPLTDGEPAVLYEIIEPIEGTVRLLLVTTLAIVALSSVASAAAITVNGTCQVGTCGSPDAVASGNALSTAFNFVVTLPNSDQYRIVGDINSSAGTAADLTVSVVSPFTVSYMGNATGTSSATDVITLDVLQNFTLAFTLRSSFETAQGGFGGALSAGSSSQVQLVINGQALPIMGPFPSPASFSVKSQSYSLSSPSNTVQFDVRHVFTFAAGSGVGATIYNALTPTSTMGGGSGSTPPAVCDASSSGESSCQAIICEDGAGSSLPIYRTGPQPRDSSTPEACSLVAENGSGGTLPILYPTGPTGGGTTPPVVVVQGSCSDVACEGSGGTLPILYPTGPTGGGGSGVVIACEGGGSTLPIYRSPGESARATAAVGPFPIEIITPLQSIAAGYTASATCSSAAANCWITIPTASGNIAASSGAAITAVVDPRGLPPGTYTASVAITISPSVGLGPSRLLNVPVTLALAAPGPYLMLSQTGLQFQAGSGATSVPAQSVSVSNAGSGTLNYAASASTLAGNWLSVSPASGTTTSEPAQVSIQANPAGLAPGVYSGLVNISAPGAVNGTQSVEVTLTVSGTPPPPSLSANALVFVAPAGTNPQAQTVQVLNPSNQTLTTAVSIGYPNGGGWLTTTASGNSVTAAQPLTETVAVSIAGLAPGTYLGSVDIHIVETNTDNLLEVLLVVKGSSCTPKRLLPVITNLGGGFVESAGFPAPLVAQVVDDCGTPLTSGAVMAYFPSGDPGVPLTASGPGQWSGTWLPHSTATAGPAMVALLATSFTPTLYGSGGVLGTVAANPTAPVVSPGGAVNSASYAAAPLAPGSRISIFGSNLAPALAENDTSPYPTKLGGTQVVLGGEALPLQVAAPGQINAVVPYDLPIGVPQQLIVQQGVNAMPENVVLAAAEPGVFTQDQSGRGPGVVAVVKPDGTAFENTPSNPASAGDTLVIYCTGLGPIAPPVPAGTAPPLSPLSNTVNPVTVTIAGIAARVPFAGLAPGFVGAYQVNVTVPAGIAPGPSVPLVLSAAGASSVPVTVAIQ